MPSLGCSLLTEALTSQTVTLWKQLTHLKVCIAEKPSVARDIANILGANSRRDGYFEGNGYAVTWTFGHFCTLKTPDEYKSEWKRWSLHDLPMLPTKFETKLMKDKGVRKQFATIKKLFKTATTVINCGDAGQEGELIQRWVIRETKYKGPVERLWISSLTPEAIREGFQKLQPAQNYDRLFFAGSSRAVGDWILGMNATRLYTLKYGGYKQVLSVGRVQTPTLAMIVKRHWEIIRFVSKPFWEIETFYRDCAFQLISGKFDNKEDGETILKRVTGKEFEIITVDKKNGIERSPKLFDLTSLQVYCNRKFGFSADRTLKVLQKLYEQKVVTYPRVDTTYLPNDVYPKCAGILGKMNSYQQFTQVLAGQKLRKPKRVFDDKKVTDHHAIIPTGYEKHLEPDLQKVYDVIARRFIAIFYPDCEVANTEVIGETAKLKFRTKGKEILKPGWKVLFPKPPPKTKSKTQLKKETDSDSQEALKKSTEVKILPAFVVGEKGPHEPRLIEKKTSPPKYYTEATLLTAMETAGKVVEDEELRSLMKANGIGRPSTRAAIIETLFRRAYIFRKGKSLIPTETGVGLIEVIASELLKSPELTGIWERKLRQIEEGDYSAKVFVNEMKTMTAQIVEEVRKLPPGKRISSQQRKPKEGFKKNSKSSIQKSNNQNKKTTTSGAKTKSKTKVGPNAKAKKIADLVCPNCNKGKILKGNSAYGCSNYTSGCGFKVPFKIQSKSISENQIVRLIAKGSTVNLKGFVMGEQKQAGKVILNAQQVPELVIATPAASKTSSSKELAPKVVCPHCKVGEIIKGKSAFGCTNWKQGCAYRFPFSEIRSKSNGQKITAEVLLSLLKNHSK